MAKETLPDGFAARIVDSLTTAMPSISAIYIFGSRARGDHQPSSDVDIFAVVPEYSVSKMKDTVSLYAPLDWLNPFDSIPYDLVLHDERTFASLAQIPGTVDYDVSKEGVKIYG